MTLGLALRFLINHTLKRDSVANIRLLRAKQYKNADTIPTKDAFDAWLLANELVLCGPRFSQSMAHSIEYP